MNTEDQNTIHIEEYDEVKIKRFSQLTPIDVMQIFRLRYNVFVLEQQSIFEEYDGKDEDATHLFIRHQNEIIAYARAYQVSPGIATFGRVAVKKEYRGKKLGSVIVSKAIDACASFDGVKEIHISAQTYLTSFYKQFGFIHTSQPYDDCGVSHTDMVKTL